MKGGAHYAAQESSTALHCTSHFRAESLFPNFKGIAVLLTAVPLFLGCEFCRRQKNFMSEKIDYSKGVYDARQLGAGRMFILGVQHMFAMFGATVLVPLLTGLSVSTTLLCAGLGTLLFHLITKKKVPAFLGSSFAYLGGFSIVAPMLADADGNLTVANTKMLPYACAAIAFSGLVYLAARSRRSSLPVIS